MYRRHDLCAYVSGQPPPTNLVSFRPTRVVRGTSRYAGTIIYAQRKHIQADASRGDIQPF